MNILLDAQEKHKLHPTTFFVPSKDKLDSIFIGDFAKLCHNHERFWVEVTQIDGDQLNGRIDNDLVHEHPFKCDDVIPFEKRNIMDIISNSAQC